MSDEWIDDLNNSLTGAEYERDGMIGHDQDGYFIPDRPVDNSWRIDRIEGIIQDTYDEAIWWHNNRISEGSDPQSGLRGVGYIPPSKMDDEAAMMGNGDFSGSYDRNGTRPYGMQTGTYTEPASGGGRIIAILVCLFVAALCWMACPMSISYIAR